jgi:signal transduction histidine kinase
VKDTTAAQPDAARSRTPTLTRQRVCVLAGVCGGLAEHLGWRVATVRWIMVGLTLVSGAGILLYAWLWALTPLQAPSGTDEESEAVKRQIPVAWLLFVIAVLLGAYALILGGTRSGGSALPAATTLMVAFAIAAVAWDQLVDTRDLDHSRAASSTLRIASGGSLVLMSLLLLVTSNSGDAGLVWLLVILTTFAGAAVLLAPWALALWRELLAERTVRVREEQRAEIAAHLHDSVLQTLALIQNRAGASSEVARIARAQERELRDWLYAGDGPVYSDLATELRAFAAALEIDHAARIEVVAVGEPVEWATAELAAASREAMLNAARHAGGDVSVYVESSDRVVDVFVRDRGAGFDLAAVPDDRLGVRESILGRMRRAGGSATVAPGAGGKGTEIRLHLERSGGEPA